MENKLTAKESSLSFVLGFVFCQLAVLVFILLVQAVGSLFTENTEIIYNFFYSNAWGYLIVTMVLDLTLLAVFLYFNKGKNNKIIAKPTAPKTMLYIGLAIITFFCLYPIVNCFDYLLQHFNIPQNTLNFSINNKTLLPAILALVIFPPIFEELLFRGLIFKGLKQYGKVFSIIFTALFFAIFHASLDQFIYPLLFGMLLSIIMYKENNILYTIAMHVTNNLLALLFTYFNLSLSFNHWSYILLAVLLVAVYLGVVLWLVFKNSKSSKLKSLGSQKTIFAICTSIMVFVWIILIATNLK